MPLESLKRTLCEGWQCCMPMVGQHGMSLMPLGAGAEWPSKRLSWLFVVAVLCERVGGGRGTIMRYL